MTDATSANADGSEPDGERSQIELTAPRMAFLALVWSDYEKFLAHRDEPAWVSRVAYALRLLLNPSLQLAFLVRCAQKGPRGLQWPIRWLQVTMFSSEICHFHCEDEIVLGPGVEFPHPLSIIIGGGAQIGAGVTIHNNVHVGGNRHAPPGYEVTEGARLGDRSVIYHYSLVQGPYDVGHDAVIGFRTIVDRHVPPGALLTYRGLRLAGEWPGEERRHYRLAHGRSR